MRTCDIARTGIPLHGNYIAVERSNALHLFPRSWLVTPCFSCPGDSTILRPLQCSRMQVSFPFPNSNDPDQTCGRLHSGGPKAAKNQFLPTLPPPSEPRLDTTYPSQRFA
jgi:hypothetical protein